MVFLNRSDEVIDKNELLNNSGFVHNAKRGTAYLFSNDALSKFLKSKGLSYVIRAHEVIKFIIIIL